eukprot:4997468-Prymnesium_polylepis.1
MFAEVGPSPPAHYSRLLFALRAIMSPLSFSEATRPSVGREPALEPIRSKRLGLQACGQQLSCCSLASG